MASVKNRRGPNIFRATNIDKNTTTEEFRTVLMENLSPEECERITISKLSLYPCPNDHGVTQTAIFGFDPDIPFFLENVAGMTMSKGTRPVTIDTNFWGLTQLNCPDNDSIALDIVAIAGLNDNAYRAWGGVTSDGPVQMWLHDFLPQEPKIGPRCRIMLYGYEPRGDISDHVKRFLEELDRARCRKGERDRPLVLIGHGYGGLIIANAFTRASRHIRYRSIYLSTIRIVSLGVPYRGIGLEAMEKQFSESTQKPLQGISLLQSIPYKAGIELLDTEYFCRLIKETSTRLCSFHETSEIGPVKRPEGKGEHQIVVSKGSIVLGLPEGLEEVYDVDGDHSSLIKFSCPTDRPYTIITNMLRKAIITGRAEVLERIAADASIRESSPREGRIFDREERKHVRDQMLRVAVAFELPFLVEQLLGYGADPNFPAFEPQYAKWDDQCWLFNINGTHDSSRQLEDTAKSQLEIAEILHSDVTALTLAVQKTNSNIVKLLLQAGADPNVRCSMFMDGRTPLHEACRIGHPEIIQHLLDYEADPNARTHTFETTPLHEVASSRSISLSYGTEPKRKLPRMLLDFNADINAKTRNSQNTPLHIAIMKGHDHTAWDLYLNGADIAAQNISGCTPLHEIVKDCRVEFLTRLLNCEQKIIRRCLDIKNNEGRTALHEAAEIGSCDLVKLLLEAGADSLIRTKDGRNAFNIAAENGHEGVMVAIRQS